MSETRVLIGVRGSFVNCPVQAQVWTDPNAGVCWQGILQIEEQGIRELLRDFDPDLLSADAVDPVLLEIIDEIIGPVSLEIGVLFNSNFRSFELATPTLQFRAIRRAHESAVIVRLLRNPPNPPEGIRNLLDLIEEVRQAMGLDELLLAYRRGDGSTLADLTGSDSASSIPQPLSAMNWLIYSKFSFDADSKSGKAIHELMGNESLDLYAGANLQGAGSPSCVVALSIPRSEAKCVTVKNLYILVELKGQMPNFRFHGTMEMGALGGACFTADCSFTPASFTLSAELQLGTKACFTEGTKPSLFDLFTLEDAGILIGYDTGLTFGLFATITALRQMVFGAAILTLEGQVPVPRLVSGAIDPVSLPSLFENVTGTNLPGLAVFDIISIDRFDDFHLRNNFRQSDLVARDAAEVAKFFNANVPQASLALAPSSLQIRARSGGYGLVDQKRMRHYFVDGVSGELSLQPQFYVSEIDTDFGNYSVKPGIFLCGKITVLRKSFELVFSLSKVSGILAYAKLDPFDITVGSFTVFRISSSVNPTPNPLALPTNNLASVLVPEHADGPVFFLSASQKDVSFYFDGHLELLELFEFDARLVYFSRRISVNLEFVFWGIRLVLLLDADYVSLLSDSLSFKLRLDTKILTEKLAAVTRAIDNAIQHLKVTVASAQASLDSAQQNVDRLADQLSYFDALIQSCKDAISDASWWKKAFVAIAKGAEIGAYEVAKAGIWTAIGVASAALQVAKLAVSAFAELGTGLLELVNATIRKATSLLYLRSAEISAAISMTKQEFSVSIGFVALGEEYSFSTSVQLDILKGDFLEFLSNELLGFLKPSLDDISQGVPPRLKTKSVPLRAPSSAPEDGRVPPPDIRGASEEVVRVSSILLYLQTRYHERFGEDLAEFSEMNASFASALQASGNALSIAKQAADTSAFKDLADHVASQDARHLSTESQAELDGALRGLKESIARQEAAATAILATESVRAEWTKLEKQPPAPTSSVGKSSEGIAREMVDFLDELEDEIRARYPHVVDRGYIILTQEPSLASYFETARAQLQAGIGPDGRPRRPTLKAVAPQIPAYRPRL